MFLRWCPAFLVFCLACSVPVSVAAGEPLWIDVRSPAEFEGAHVAQAINIPHGEISSRIPEVTHDKDASIYLYCRSGRRSGIAQKTLEGMGYTRVINIGGLDEALKKAGQGNPP
jgi:phage shock protein E